MIKQIIKVLGNGLFYGIFFFLISFSMGHFIINLPIKNNLLISIPIGISALIINGAIYSRFTKSTKILEAIKIEIDTSETIIIQAPANHLINDDIVSGKLCLTENELIFKAFNQEKFIWDVNNLHSMKFYVSIKNSGGEFTMLNENNRKIMFEVDNLKSWKIALTKRTSHNSYYNRFGQ